MYQKFFGAFLLITLLISCQQNPEHLSPDIAPSKLESDFLAVEKRLMVHYRNTDSAVHYGNTMVALAEQINKPDYLGRAYNAQASAFDQLQQYDSAIKYFGLAQTALIEAADTTNLSSATLPCSVSLRYLNIA